MTQIQLEHTRKLTFIADNNSSGLTMSPSVEGDFGPESHGNQKQPTQPSTQFKKYALGVCSVTYICVPMSLQKAVPCAGRGLRQGG